MLKSATSLGAANVPMRMRDYVHQQTVTLLRRLAYNARQAYVLGTPDSIHDLRVALRRFIECLRVFESFYPSGEALAVRRKLRVVMKLTAEVRGRDIAIELFDRAEIDPLPALAQDRSLARQHLLLVLKEWTEREIYRKWRESLQA